MFLLSQTSGRRGSLPRWHWLALPLLLLPALCAAGGPNPQEKLYHLGSCQNGAKCGWNCFDSDLTFQPVCGSGQCSLVTNGPVTARMRITAADACPNSDGVVLTVGVTVAAANGTRHVIRDQRIDLCGRDISCGNGSSTCDGSAPRDRVYLCSTDGGFFYPDGLPSAGWMLNQVLWPTLAGDLCTPTGLCNGALVTTAASVVPSVCHDSTCTDSAECGTGRSCERGHCTCGQDSDCTPAAPDSCRAFGRATTTTLPNVCGPDFPVLCNGQCWGCGDETTCCPATGDPTVCCDTAAGERCTEDGLGCDTTPTTTIPPSVSRDYCLRIAADSNAKDLSNGMPFAFGDFTGTDTSSMAVEELDYCLCGNGTLDAGEGCDLGASNGDAGSCCTMRCEPAEGPCPGGTCMAAACVPNTTTTTTTRPSTTVSTLPGGSVTSTTTTPTPTVTTTTVPTCAVRCLGLSQKPLRRCRLTCRRGCKTGCSPKPCALACPRGAAGKACRRGCRSASAACQKGCAG